MTMWELTLQVRRVAHSPVCVYRKDELVLGWGDGADLEILTAEPVHARIAVDAEGRCWVTNVSEAGTWVNGQRVVEPVMLGLEDELSLRPHQDLGDTIVKLAAPPVRSPAAHSMWQVELVQIEVGPATVETIRKARVVIGSAAPADLLLRSDDVSAQHCELDIDPAGNVTVVDLDSELGTYVAGELVSARRPLAVNAELGVGEYVVRLAHAPVEVAEFPWQTTLTIMERGGEPSTVTLRQREINIGRVASAGYNDIVLPRGNVSKRHCRISIRDDGTAYVVDLKSSNGTWMNGRNLVRHVQQFRVGDRLHVGDWVICLAHPPEKH